MFEPARYPSNQVRAGRYVWDTRITPEEQNMQDDGLRAAYERTVNAGTIKKGSLSELESDPVNHPPHYNSHPSGVECIEIVRWFNYNKGNAIKYIWRAGSKEGANELEDLEKAAWYINDEIIKLKSLQEKSDENTLAPESSGITHPADSL